MRTALYLFAALSDTDVGWMARVGELRQFAPEQVLIRQGEQPEGLLIVLRGSVRVDIGGGTIALRREGECLGEVSLVDTRPASTDVIAAEPAVVLLLRHPVLQSRLDSDTAFAMRCYRGLAILLANRLREATVGAIDLDDTMLDGMARAGERFRLLLEYVQGRLP